MSRSAIEHRIKHGRLLPIHRGVYLVGHRPAPALAAETAALLALGPQAVLSHRTAAALWGVLREPGLQIHLSFVDRRPPRPRPGSAAHGGVALETRGVTRRHGLPLTTPLRTIVDLTTSATARELARAIVEAEVRRLVRRRGPLPRLGAGEDRQGVDVQRAAQGDDAGPTPRDVCRPLQVPSHRTRAAFERDRRRDAELQAHGLRVMRTTSRQIVDQPEALVARLAGALAQGGEAYGMRPVRATRA